MDDAPKPPADEQTQPGSTSRLIRRVRKATERRFTAEDKIRIVLEGSRKELPVSDICRREGISPLIYYNWLKQFMEAGKARLKGDTLRGATPDEVKQLRSENTQLKELLGQQSLESWRCSKKVCSGRPKMVSSLGTMGKADVAAGAGCPAQAPPGAAACSGYPQIDLL